MAIWLCHFIVNIAIIFNVVDLGMGLVILSGSMTLNIPKRTYN